MKDERESHTSAGQALSAGFKASDTDGEISGFVALRQGNSMKKIKKSIGLNVLAASPMVAQGLLLGVSLASFCIQPAYALEEVAPQVATVLAPAEAPTGLNGVKRVNFEHESVSPATRDVADWVVDANDNHNMPFVIVDKTNAKVFVFHADGRLRGAAFALLGLAVGDDSVPGIGDRKLSSIRPDERTTPAGRFEAALDRNLHGGEILWVDYESAISLHPVLTSNAKERRAERLTTPSPLDNRISYGCINVPAEFFKNVVSAAFKGTNGIVYVLPETRSAQKVFASYDVEERMRLQTVNPPVRVQMASGADR